MRHCLLPTKQIYFIFGRSGLLLFPLSTFLHCLQGSPWNESANFDLIKSTLNQWRLHIIDLHKIEFDNVERLHLSPLLSKSTPSGLQQVHLKLIPDQVHGMRPPRPRSEGATSRLALAGVWRAYKNCLFQAFFVSASPNLTVRRKPKGNRRWLLQ